MSLMSKNTNIILVGLSLIAVVAFWFSSWSDRAAPEVPPTAAALLPGADQGAERPPLSDLEDPDLGQGPEERTASEFPSEDSPSPALEERPLGEHGQLRMEILDSMTGEPLTQYVLSLAQASAPQTKLFAVTPQNLQNFQLPAGAYIGVLFHPGYDLRSVDIFTVINEETTDLGVIYVERGSAGIAVRVLAPTALIASVQSIDLHAAGRWPGRCCESDHEANERPSPTDGHCPLCGYGSTFSRLTYEPGKSFPFANLSSGPVQLIVRSASDSILAIDRIELEPRELRQVILEISVKDVEIRLVDANDEPFDGLWVEGVEIFVAPIQFNIYSDDVVVAVAEIAPAMQLGEEFNGGNFPAGSGAGSRPVGDSEASQDSLRALWPRALTTPTGIKPSRTPISRIRPGVYLMSSVPASSNAALVACGPFANLSTTPFNIENQKDVVTIKMDTRCGLSTRKFMSGPKMNTCTACHHLTISD